MKTLNVVILSGFLTGVLGSTAYLMIPFNVGLSMFCFVLALPMLILFFVNAVHFVRHG